MPVIRAAAATDVGSNREINEDSVLAINPVYVVADGMGGHEAGEVASARAIAEMAHLIDLRRPVTEDDVKAAVRAAQFSVSQLATERRRLMAGTTLTGVVIVHRDGQPWWMILNLGDSRTYKLVNGELTQVSIDHSEVQELVNIGHLTPAEARVHPRRNVVTRALGAGGRFQPDYWLLPLQAGDRLMICSDGLTGEVTDDVIAGMLLFNPEPPAAAQALVAEALRMGGSDNVSVIVVDAISDTP
ncbi:MAG: protein phosphatase 2C domain-containing protein [Bifidobacteriaceae bacterium]|jgi:protein phosphatase|nr:protein phosphatase 2C domain-containing protein [Bifidobacteriaceae bacterium]